MAVVAGSSTPPVFFNSHHAGYEDSWNKAEWSDPHMTKSFGEYMTEAVQRGWWGGLNRPGRGTDPQVLFVVGTNPLRRARGGRRTLLENLWPKLEKIVAVDFRMSTTALHADIVLPAAMHYERTNLQYAITHTFRLVFSDEAVPPAGEARTEWQIFRDLAEKVSEVAEAEGLEEYLDGRRQARRLDDLVERFTSEGAFESEEAVIDEWVRDSVEAETLPPGTSIDTLREDGSVRFTSLGVFAPGLSVAGDVERDKVLTSYTWHVEKGTPFPTLTRRAQFYLDHPWFIEADEALPRHKEPPKQGGDYPFLVTSGHSPLERALDQHGQQGNAVDPPWPAAGGAQHRRRHRTRHLRRRHGAGVERPRFLRGDGPLRRPGTAGSASHLQRLRAPHVRRLEGRQRGRAGNGQVAAPGEPLRPPALHPLRLAAHPLGPRGVRRHRGPRPRGWRGWYDRRHRQHRRHQHRRHQLRRQSGG
ncbi:MAG: molybdopterin-dependent oxidoreductase [Microthrixaceae bacterium]|nr:molybdopterin-dependent oxidoreductase [Microthrixaceae bacterium]